MPVRLTPWRISDEKTTGLDYFTCDNCGFYKLKRDVKIALEPLYDAAYKCKKSGCGHDFYVVKAASPRFTKPGCKYVICSKRTVAATVLLG